MGTVEDTDPAIELLTDLRDILVKTEAAIIPTKDIIDRLVAQDDRPWATWRHDKPITGRGLARLLGPLGIHPDKFGDVRGYRTTIFDDAISRYLPSQVSKCPIANKDGPKQPDTCDLDGVDKNASVRQFRPDSIGEKTQGHIDDGDAGDDLEEHY